jgi:hypothetical protein
VLAAETSILVREVGGLLLVGTWRLLKEKSPKHANLKKILVR